MKYRVEDMVFRVKGSDWRDPDAYTLNAAGHSDALSQLKNNCFTRIRSGSREDSN